MVVECRTHGMQHRYRAGTGKKKKGENRPWLYIAILGTHLFLPFL